MIECTTTVVKRNVSSNKVSVYNKTGKCLQMQAIMTDEEFGQLELYPDFSIRFYSEKRCKCNDFRNNISCPYSIPKKGADASDFGIRLDSYFMFLRFTAKNIRRLGENPS